MLLVNLVTEIMANTVEKTLVSHWVLEEVCSTFGKVISWYLCMVSLAATGQEEKRITNELCSCGVTLWML